MGRWEFRDNHYVFRRHIEKWLEKNGAEKIEFREHRRHTWQVETIVGMAYVILPGIYRNVYLALIKFENPFMAVQVEPLVDYEKKELIFTFPYIETGQPYSAARKFIKQFKKFLKDENRG